MTLSVLRTHSRPCFAIIVLLAFYMSSVSGGLAEPAAESVVEPSGNEASVCASLALDLQLILDRLRAKTVAHEALAENRQELQRQADAVARQIAGISAESAEPPPDDPSAEPPPDDPSAEPPPDDPSAKLVALQSQLEALRSEITVLDGRLSPLLSETDALKLEEEDLRGRLAQNDCPH